MNTLGKLLVILNLLFALLTGAFLAVDYASRTNWKDVAEARQSEMDALRANSESEVRSKRELVKANEQIRGEMDALTINKNSQLAQMKLENEKLARQVGEQKAVAELAVLNQENAIQQTKRLQGEVVLLLDTVKKREEEIVGYQTRITDVTQKYTQRENEAATANARAQNLFLQLKEKEIYIAKLLGGGGSGDGTKVVAVPVRDPNFVNPPPVDVRGLIQKVDTEQRDLVQISLGSDDGLQKDHTMEVYRLSPSPQYLGRLRVLDVYPRTAVGRVVRSASMSGVPALLEGDQVASKLK